MRERMVKMEEERELSTEEMQRFLDWCAMKGIQEKDAYEGLMYILGVHYPVAEKEIGGREEGKL